MFRWIIDCRINQPDEQLDPEVIPQVEEKMSDLLGEIKNFTSGKGDEEATTREICRSLDTMLHLPILRSHFPLARSRKYKEAVEFIQVELHDHPAAWPTLLGWLFTHALGKVVNEDDSAQISRSWIDEWLLGKIIADTMRDLGLDDATSWKAIALIKILISHQRWYEIQTSSGGNTYQVLETWLKDSQIQQFLQVNRYQGILWFNKEAFEQLLRWMLMIAVITTRVDTHRPTKEIAREIVAYYDMVREMYQAMEESGYQVEKLLELVRRRET
jgi:hypothetical protein